MRRVLLTGGSGFVGANLARRLLAGGHEVHLLVRPGYQPWRIAQIRDSIQLHETELDDAAGVQRVVKTARPEWIFHLAVHGAYSWQKDLDAMVRTNFHGTIHLVQAALANGVEAFINTGSSSEYGLKDHAPPETEVLEPNSHYAVTKAAATMFCKHMASTCAMRIATLRLYSAFGPYEDPGRLLPALIAHGRRGEYPPLAAPDVARDFIYVDDVVDAFLLAAQVPGSEPGAVYNIGSGVETKLRDAVEVARKLMNIHPEPVWGSMPNRAWDATVWVSDNRKARQELGWNPRHTFESGFRAMLEWEASTTDAASSQPPHPSAKAL